MMTVAKRQKYLRILMVVFALLWGGNIVLSNVIATQVYDEMRRERTNTSGRRTEGLTERQTVVASRSVALIPLNFPMVIKMGIDARSDMPASEIGTRKFTVLIPGAAIMPFLICMAVALMMREPEDLPPRITQRSSG